jgi:glycosyltransferase involved in cell wall biosynthesis
MKTRVLHIIETLGPGGVEQRRYLLSKYLNSDRFEQKIICTQTKGPLADAIRENGVEVYVVGKLKSILSIGNYKKVLSIIRQFKPHIIHGAVFEGITMASICGVLGRVPIVVLEETSDPQNRSWRGNMLLKILAAPADFFVGVSPSAVEYLKNIGISPAKVRLINNGVEVPTFQDTNYVSALKKQLGIDSSDFVVGSVGRLRDYHKRFSDLIRAVALLRNNVPSIKLLIIGDGTDLETLKSLAVELDVSSRVIFAGFQYETAPYYLCMNVFALASHMEAFGLVLAEAMFFRLPVVASNVGGMRYIVVPEKTGFLVPRHQPESFAFAIKQLYDQPVLRKQMGEAGYERALQEYSAEAYVSRVSDLYEHAVQEKQLRI